MAFYLHKNTCASKVFSKRTNEFETEEEALKELENFKDFDMNGYEEEFTSIYLIDTKTKKEIEIYAYN